MNSIVHFVSLMNSTFMAAALRTSIRKSKDKKSRFVYRSIMQKKKDSSDVFIDWLVVKLKTNISAN